MQDKPKRWTWEEWQVKLDEAMKGEWYYTETHIQNALEANNQVIEHLEKELYSKDLEFSKHQTRRLEQIKDLEARIAELSYSCLNKAEKYNETADLYVKSEQKRHAQQETITKLREALELILNTVSTDMMAQHFHRVSNNGASATDYADKITNQETYLRYRDVFLRARTALKECFGEEND